MIDIEEWNPVWLKDKGDHFFEKNDYKSAINAYSKAIEYDLKYFIYLEMTKILWKLT